MGLIDYVYVREPVKGFPAEYCGQNFQTKCLHDYPFGRTYDLEKNGVLWERPARMPWLGTGTINLLLSSGTQWVEFELEFKVGFLQSCKRL